MDLSTLGTETRNKRTADLDRMPVGELLSVMNAEDQTVAFAVREALPQIGAAVEAITGSLWRGGRLVYLGAGTSGRIGLLDAVECPPTFGIPNEQVVGLVCGGPGAFSVAVEGAEDDPDRAARDLDDIDVNDRDTVVGLAASGRTPYVVGGLQRAHAAGEVDNGTYEAATDEIDVVARHITDHPTPENTGRLLVALKRLRGLIADVATLAEKVATIIAAVRSIR